MDKHYHLLVQTPDANLSRCMRPINGIYTQRFNAQYGYDWQLFRGRYKAILVGEDRFLLQFVRYIRNNSLMAEDEVNGEVFFLLTAPLMGDPNFLNNILRAFDVSDPTAPVQVV